MRCLTVWNPWAVLIAAGVKPYEFRSWVAPAWIRGQRIAIHAGARKPKRGEVEDIIHAVERGGGRDIGITDAEKALQVLLAPETWWYSSVLCTAVIGRHVRACHLAELGVTRNDSDRDDHFNFAWPLQDVVRLEPPVPARGAQGFWNWEPTI